MVEARFIVRTAVIAALATACAPSGNETDVARAMCAKNVLCGNSWEPVEECTPRVAATMPHASCTTEQIQACEDAIDSEPCKYPEAQLPASCMPCD